jgi:hypothetical protein
MNKYNARPHHFKGYRAFRNLQVQVFVVREEYAEKRNIAKAITTGVHYTISVM